MEEALIGQLLASSSLAALVAARVYPARRPQASDLPAVVLTRVDGVRQYADEGPIDLVQSRVQLDCWARTYAEAKAVARAVRDALLDLEGVYGGVEFQASHLEAERDFAEDGANQAEYLHRVVLEFLVWHRES
jgi:hypothetical protein